jgi:Flp pilus assembly protein TadB
MFVINPEYIANLFTHPAGRMLVSASVVANIVAHLVIRHLSKIRI